MRLTAVLLLALAVTTALAASPMVGTSCSTVGPDNVYDCCVQKAADGNEDPYCVENYDYLYKQSGQPAVGSSCSTVTPGQNEACCQRKADDGTSDTWCEKEYPELYSKPPGSSCSTVSPDSREDCCKTKVQEDTADDWCEKEYPDLYSPPLGSSCGTVSPDYREQCCETKVQEDTEDDWCKETYPSLYNITGNTADYPYMAYIESSAAPNGSCGGTLVAPGYVLTAAQCVFKDGKAADAKDVSVWIGGKWHDVQTVLVDLDNAQFDEFQGSKSKPSWDVAMLALAEDSTAKYAALPLSAVPKLGDWVDTSAWEVPQTTVITAQVPVWDGCSQKGWADQFCAGGSGFLQSCPEDKGSPVMQGNTLVGLTSYPGCDGTADNWGYFLKLSDKGILEQITVWLNSRQGTDNSGLDENMTNWLIEANTYLYGRK